MVNKFKAHPWHGITVGENAPNVVTAFIEIVPTDTVKYEIDKETGFLKIDRPQKFSNVIPTLYGFIPQTYCDVEIAAFASLQSGRKIEKVLGQPNELLSKQRDRSAANSGQTVAPMDVILAAGVHPQTP